MQTFYFEKGYFYCFFIEFKLVIHFSPIIIFLSLQFFFTSLTAEKKTIGMLLINILSLIKIHAAPYSKYCVHLFCSSMLYY